MPTRYPHEILDRWNWLDSYAVQKLVTSPSTKLVLHCLVLKWTNRKSGKSWPSGKTISSYTGVSLSTVRRSMRELQNKNLIHKTGNSKSAVWKINFDLKSRADYEKEIDDLESKWKQKGWDYLTNLPPMNEQIRMDSLTQKLDSTDAIQ